MKTNYRRANTCDSCKFLNYIDDNYGGAYICNADNSLAHWQDLQKFNLKTTTEQEKEKFYDWINEHAVSFTLLSICDDYQTKYE